MNAVSSQTSVYLKRTLSISHTQDSCSLILCCKTRGLNFVIQGCRHQQHSLYVYLDMYICSSYVLTCLRSNRVYLDVAPFLRTRFTRCNWAECDISTLRSFWAGTADPWRRQLAAASEGRQELLCSGRNGVTFRIRWLQPGALLSPWPLPLCRRKLSK